MYWMMLKHGGTSKTPTTLKKPEAKPYILLDSIYMKFQKRQMYRKKQSSLGLWMGVESVNKGAQGKFCGWWQCSKTGGWWWLHNFCSIKKPRTVHLQWVNLMVYKLYINKAVKGFPGGASGKEPTCQCRRHKRHGFSPWVGKIPWRRAWLPTLVFLLGESHGQRSVAGYSS